MYFCSNVNNKVIFKKDKKSKNLIDKFVCYINYLVIGLIEVKTPIFYHSPF